MKRLLLTSAGFENPEFAELFLNEVGIPANQVKVLFIPTAAINDDAKKVLPKCYEDLTNCGVLPENITVYDLDRTLTVEEISEQHAIYVCGGSTEYLLERMNAINFSNMLEIAFEHNLIYIGVSAGSIVCGKNLPQNLCYFNKMIGVHCEEGRYGEDFVHLTNQQAIWIHGEDTLILPETTKTSFMKKEFSSKPEKIVETWPGELVSMTWEDLVLGIPSPLFLVTTYKSNGKENACLQAWSSFVSDSGKFICIIGSVSKGGHLYQSLKETKCCVLNFPSRDIYDKCYKTIEHNGFDDDEISMSGLTAEQATSINAPRIAECFLNIECELLWEREHFEGSRDVTMAVCAKNICMDRNHYDEHKLGRYGKSGYMYNIQCPRNPETGEETPTCFGAIERYE